MTSTRSPSRPRSRSTKKPTGRSTRTWLTAAVVAIAAVAALAVVYATSGGSRAGTAEAGEYAFAVGDPGPGEQAPAFELPSTTGGTVALDDYRGETVLLASRRG